MADENVVKPVEETPENAEAITEPTKIEGEEKPEAKVEADGKPDVDGKPEAGEKTVAEGNPEGDGKSEAEGKPEAESKPETEAEEIQGLFIEGEQELEKIKSTDAVDQIADENLEDKKSSVKDEEKSQLFPVIAGQDIDTKESEIDPADAQAAEIAKAKAKDATVEDFEIPLTLEDKALGDDVEPEGDEEIKEQVSPEQMAGIQDGDESRRHSYEDKKTSIQYEFKSRVGDELRVSKQISGDFLPITGDILVLRQPLKGVEEEVVEEERLPWIQQAPPVGYSTVKDFLIAKIDNLNQQRILEKLRNSILQIFITRYYKRRNLEHFLRHIDHPFEHYIKYQEKLDELGHFFVTSKKEHEHIELEVETFRKMRDKKKDDLDTKLAEFQAKEAATGYGLIFRKTGAVISDKVVDNYLRRQRNSVAALSAMRFQHVQIKSAVADKQQKIRDLDKVDSKYTLMYYEKLKAENRTHSDKMEEKETALTKSRKLSKDTIEILCHVREKSAALSSDLLDAQEDLRSLEEDITAFRRFLNEIKQERDHYRSLAVTLKNESGLLLQPELLRDMEASKAEYASLKHELEIVKEDYKVKTKQQRDLRKMVQMSSKLPVKKEKRIDKSVSTTPVDDKPNKDDSKLPEFKPMVTVIST